MRHLVVEDSEIYTGFGYHRGKANVIPMAHHHSDLELNFLCSGTAVRHLRNSFYEIPLRQLTVFWGFMPHHIVSASEDAFIIAIHVPNIWLIEWGLPQAFLENLFQGVVLSEPDARMAAYDETLMNLWFEDLLANADVSRTVLPEMQARLHRFARSCLQMAAMEHQDPACFSLTWKRVQQISQFLAENFKEPLRIEDIASAVGLSPYYVMHIFREHCGVTLLDYLNKFRIAHAQHLLLTTNATVIDIAMESGFTSVSSFYAAFKRVTGVCPNRYRRGLRGTASPDTSPALPKTSSDPTLKNKRKTARKKKTH